MVKTLVSAGKLSLFCTRLVVGSQHPQPVGQPGCLSLPSHRGWKIGIYLCVCFGCGYKRWSHGGERCGIPPTWLSISTCGLV